MTAGRDRPCLSLRIRRRGWQWGRRWRHLHPPTGCSPQGVGARGVWVCLGGGSSIRPSTRPPGLRKLGRLACRDCRVLESVGCTVQAFAALTSRCTHRPAHAHTSKYTQHTHTHTIARALSLTLPPFPPLPLSLSLALSGPPGRTLSPTHIMFGSIMRIACRGVA